MASTRLSPLRVGELLRTSLAARAGLFHAPNIPAALVRAAAPTLLRNLGPLEQLLTLIALSQDASSLQAGMALLDQRFVCKARDGAAFSVRYQQLARAGSVERRAATVIADGWVCAMGSEALAIELAHLFERLGALARGEIEREPMRAPARGQIEHEPKRTPARGEIEREPNRARTPIESPPLAAEVPLWRFLWGAGSRRLQLTRHARPDASARSVESLAELVKLIADSAGDAALHDALRFLLERGLLEHWLCEAAHAGDLALATRELRLDGRPKKLARFLDRAARVTPA